MNRSRHARVTGYVVSLAVLAWFAGSPAAAQMYQPPAPYYGVDPGQVLARIQSLGLRAVSEPRLRGPVWVVRAVGREGTLVRVLVDAQSGRVVNIVAINEPYPPRLASGGPVSEGPWVPMRGPGYGNDLPPPPAGGGYGPPPAGGGYPPSGGAYAPGPQSARGPADDSLTGMPPEFRKGANGNAVQPEKKVASHPTTPLPKPRPSEAPQDASKKDAPTVAATPSEPETTGSVPASEKKDGASSGAPAKASIPVSPLE
jgi:hypothetical protein